MVKKNKIILILIFFIILHSQMVDVAQQVRALDCGSRGRGFEPHLPPLFIPTS